MSLASWLHLSPSTPRFEPLATEHAETLARIHGAAFARPWSAFEFEHLLAERNVIGDGLFLGRASQPVGFALSRRVVDEAEILTIALLPNVRGRGWSTSLLRRHLEELARLGVRNVHLEVEDGNAPALALYRKVGFGQIGRRDAYYQKPDGSRVAALTMSAVL